MEEVSNGRSPQAGRATLASHQAPAGLGHAEGIPNADKPRVSLGSYRILERIWPYASQYNNSDWRSEIVADILDGWVTQKEMRPMIDDGLVYLVRSYDPTDCPKLYISWNPTEKGERAIFGPAQVDGNPKGGDAKQAPGDSLTARSRSDAPDTCSDTAGRE